MQVNNDVNKQTKLRFRRVALMVETTKPLGRNVLTGIANYARTRAHWSPIIEERNPSGSLPTWLMRSVVDGIICRGSDSTIIDFALSREIPIVKLGGESVQLIPTVVTNDEMISCRVAEHLLTRKLKSFAFIGVLGKQWSELRRNAFVRILHDAGLECQCFDLPSSGTRRRSWYRDQQAISVWIESLPLHTAVFVAYDQLGLLAINACHQIGRLIPEQIILIGVDNDKTLCELADPPLSSVAQDFARIGYVSAQLLDGLMHGDTPCGQRHLINPLNVVERHSSDMILVSDGDVAKALLFIRENACQGLDVTSVASHVGISRRVLERRFAQCIKRSPKEEILRLQVDRVKELLVESEFTLATIARLAGFNHTSYMCALFKKRSGVPPGEYRRLRGTLS